MDKVKINGEDHRVEVLISTIKNAKTISIMASELAEFVCTEETVPELDAVYVAVIKRGDKYVPLNGRRNLTRLMQQGIGIEGKPLHVKIISSVMLKKSRIERHLTADEVHDAGQKLVNHFNVRHTNYPKAKRRKDFSLLK